MARVAAILFTVLIAFSCSGEEDSSTETKQAATPPPPCPKFEPNTGGTCRNYATSYTKFSTTTTCSFDTCNKLTCSDGTDTNVTSYSSLNDFVDEAQTVGRNLAVGFSLSGSFSATGTAGYDPLKRLRSVNIFAFGGVFSINFSAWDASGRPTNGTQDLSFGEPFPASCNGAIVTASYNDLARTSTQTVDDTAPPALGIACNSGVEVTTITYDTNGNIINEDGISVTVNSTSAVCY